MTTSRVTGSSKNAKHMHLVGIAPLAPDETVCPSLKDCPLPGAVALGDPPVGSDETVCPSLKDCPIPTARAAGGLA